MDKKQNAGNRIFNFLRRNLWVILLDILAVNVSYFAAIYLRFFVAGEMDLRGVVYPARFWMITPFYTAAALVTFYLFRLYSGKWQYAAINDVNRIIFASLVTAVLQVVISLLVLAILPQSGRHVSRMPVSYYLLGAAFQLILVFLIRFSHKFIRQEIEKIAKSRSDTIPALVIGSGDLGMKVVRHLESSTMFRTAVIAGEDAGQMLDGIPVVPVDTVEAEIQAKGIRAVFIADKTLTKEDRERIRKAAEGLEVNDFTGYMSNLSGFLPLTNLLEVMETPITVEVEGKTQTFSSAEECLAALPGEYDVVKVKASSVVLKKRRQDDSWMKVYQEQTGREVSYF